MAASLMPLLPTPGSANVIKHVVPWKYRKEFHSVYEDLYNEDEALQLHAINRIATWKARAGSKLSVAIESSANLQQVSLDYRAAKSDGSVHKKDAQLRASCSLALIRFVNHITEKAQTKAVAQPVHLVAREFGIPEWLVRIRHDTTHGTMPCLDTLVIGVEWALAYLKEQFWQMQLEEATGTGDETELSPQEKKGRKLKMANIRAAMYDFQKARFKELQESEESESAKEGQNSNLQTLQSYLSQNRLQFIKCFLEDGVLISTSEQLEAFGVHTDDLLAHSPPAMPIEITEFWRPLLRKLYMYGALPLLMHTTMFSVTSEPGLRNYQLVAWLIYLLAQSSDSGQRSKRKKRRKQEDLVKSPVHIPKKTLLAACLQNINAYTIHMIKYLADRESLGADAYDKLMKLLNIDTEAASRPVTSDDSGSETDDTCYTVEDLKREKELASKQTEQSSTVEHVQNTIDQHDVPWAICTDIFDWSSIPFGVIPDLTNEETKSEDDDDIDSNGEHDDSADDADTYRVEKKKSRLNSDHDSDDDVGPKRSSYVPKEEIL